MESEYSLATCVFASKYKIVRKLATGSYGTVYLGENKNTKESVAIKLEAITKKKSSLSNEMNAYKYLKACDHVPSLHYFGQDHGFNLIVMDLLGPSLKQLQNKYSKFSMKTVLQLANQILLGLEYLHKLCIVHRDIKPENLLIGRGNNSYQVFITDFGLAKKYETYGQHFQIPCKEKGFLGNPKFASCNAHLRHPQSARDDLESMGYMLIWFLKANLPWCDINYLKLPLLEMLKIVGEMKVATEVNVLCKGLPEEFTTYLKYCRGLKFMEEPDYEYLRELFISLVAKMDYTFDNVFEWTQSQEY